MSMSAAASVTKNTVAYAHDSNFRSLVDCARAFVSVLRVRSVRESICMSVSQSASASVSVSASMPPFMTQKNRQRLVPWRLFLRHCLSLLSVSLFLYYRIVRVSTSVCHFVHADQVYCLQQPLSVLQHDSIIHGIIYAYT